jgi:hypothetical protein
MLKKLYLERALFVVGLQDSGKSTQIRSIFKDMRFGTNGEIPSQSKLPDSYFLSNDRKIYIRITSPHESKETLKEFLDKTERKTFSDRWCVVAPLQPNAINSMPDLAQTVKAFSDRFDPDRIRIVFLLPDRHGNDDYSIYQKQLEDLFAIDCVECLSIDASQLPPAKPGACNV